MKKLIGIAICSVILLPLSALAASHYGMGGCGLGSKFFETNSTGSQILASTTNGTSGNQTFGISSGTSNCTKDGMIKSEVEKNVFIAMNFDLLNEEMAQGQGETLAALANLYGCDDPAAFGDFAKTNYVDKFSKAENANELQETLESAIYSDEKMAGTCRVAS